ncbi:MAG: pyridoxal-dependent decarboxylase, exosortase A system-associated [Gammaproteobacteria bacterium]|nr:pyridoxal-dependent decarboxylase, exosortase A system-associated [Gammaproteobacteria bacterium]
MSQFQSKDGELLVGGIPLRRLAARVGQTPFYAYDRRLLSERVRHLRASLPEGIQLHFAMKANPMPAVVQHLAPLVDGLDVASLKELRVALDTGTDPAHISFAGPGKGEVEIRAAVAAGITLNIESERELPLLAKASAELGVPARVAVRVNPDFELKGAGMKMGGGSQQFGIDAERVPEILARIGELNLDFQGFHIFTGSQNLRSEAITTAHDAIFALAYRLAEHAPQALSHLNIGGGFGVPYFPGDKPLDLAPIAANLARHQAEASERLGGQCALVIELGRYLVAESGIYVCEILDRKLSRGEVLLISNGGLHHHLSAAGLFGQIIRKNYPVAIGTKMGSADIETASVVGPLCTPLDLLANKMELARAEAGDLVVVYQSGAYGMSASPKDFLSHNYPVEVLV